MKATVVTNKETYTLDDILNMYTGSMTVRELVVNEALDSHGDIYGGPDPEDCRVVVLENKVQVLMPHVEWED
jgi:hypothetical protein